MPESISIAPIGFNICNAVSYVIPGILMLNKSCSYFKFPTPQSPIF